MKWSWKIGRIAGISVYVHATFLLLIAWLALIGWTQGHDARSVVNGIIFILALFVCVVLHEVGHALAAKHYGIGTRDITLLPIGGVSRLERMPEAPQQELWVALAGPAVSLGISVVLFLLLWAVGAPISISQIAQMASRPGVFAFVEQLMFANLVLAVFNLLPAFPMDGGRVLRALLGRYMDHARATRVAATVGQGMALLFGLLGLLTNPFLLFIALFVWIGAGQEAAMAQVKSALEGIPVSQLTVTEFSEISPSDPLQRAVEVMLHGTQQDFPVVENGRLVGILTRRDLLSGLSQKGPDSPVSEVMREDYPTISAWEMVQTALDKLQDSGLPMLPVVDKSGLLGFFTVENLGEFVMVQSALNNPKGKMAYKNRKQAAISAGDPPKRIA